MNINYSINNCKVPKSIAEIYFGKQQLSELTDKAIQEHNESGEISYNFWKNDVGYLNIVLDIEENENKTEIS